MIYSKETIRFAKSLVSTYIKFDSQFKDYILDINKLPEFELSEFATLLMSENKSLANEVTGSDNPAYEKTMLPAFIKSMKNTLDKDAQFEFIEEWNHGAVTYLMNIMEEIIRNLCEDKLHEERIYHGFYASKSRVDGETTLGRFI